MEKKDHITLSDVRRREAMAKASQNFVKALRESHPERFGLPPRKRVLVIGGR